MSTVNDLLWVEKYRPKTLSDCILPTDLGIIFQGIVKDGNVPNMLLYGKAGTGKTTVAKALANDVNSEYILINCSEENGIDTLRTKIRQYASTVSLNGNQKIIILDEFDYANAQSIQPALRGAIEEFHKNCRFILTCNYKNRIIDPLHSRCTTIDFTIPSSEKSQMATQMMKRVEFILDAEKVPYEKQIVVNLIKKHFPDLRRIINELQKYSSIGKIDIGILAQGSSESFKELISFMKKKEFTSCRKWVIQNIDLNTADFYRKLYEELYSVLKPNSIPQAILIIAEYQHKAAFAMDQEINTMALIVQLMLECEFV